MNDWEEIDDVLTKEFEFEDFSSAIGFVNKVADIAEELDHHPNIEVFDYKKVRIRSTTHSVGNKITEKDRDIARRIDGLFKVNRIEL